MDAKSIWRDIAEIRKESPLVHNITNYVVMNSTANALLALGASPVMAHAIDEVRDMVALARSLVLNIGTLSSQWIAAMKIAGVEAHRLKIPVVIDPVGCGATHYRTATALDLVGEVHPAVIRGNASEIRALVHGGKGTKGVDSTQTPDEVVDDAGVLSRSMGCVVSVSGPVDLIVSDTTVVCVENGHPMMSRVTGMGCTSSALTGAFIAVNKSPLDAAVHAMATMGISGEIAAQRAAGPGSFQMHFLDTLFSLTETDLATNCRISVG